MIEQSTLVGGTDYLSGWQHLPDGSEFPYGLNNQPGNIGFDNHTQSSNQETGGRLATDPGGGVHFDSASPRSPVARLQAHSVRNLTPLRFLRGVRKNPGDL